MWATETALVIVLAIIVGLVLSKKFNPITPEILHFIDAPATTTLTAPKPVRYTSVEAFLDAYGT